MNTRFSLAPKVAAACLLLSLVGLLSATGCGSSSAGPDAKSDAAKLDIATKARAMFDGAHGDYNALSETDKAAYVKMLGGQKPADELWNTMKGPGAPANTAPVGGPPGTTTAPR